METLTTPAVRILQPGQHVTVKGWGIYATVGTAREAARKYKQDPEEMHKREQERGYPTAWTLREVSMLVGDREEGKRMADERRSILSAAIELTEGEVVNIEGEVYVTRILGKRYSDPIAFRK